MRLQLIVIKRKGSILVNNDNSFLSAASPEPQEPIICHFLRIIILVCAYGICVHHSLTWNAFEFKLTLFMCFNFTLFLSLKSDSLTYDRDH